MNPLIAIAAGIFLFGGFCFFLLKKKGKPLQVDRPGVVYFYTPNERTFGMPSISPFVMKLEAWFRLNKIEYETRLFTFKAAPKGKMPFIKIDGQTMGDSQLIIDHLSAQRGLRDNSISSAQQAADHATRVLLEESLNQCIRYSRWAYSCEENWPLMVQAVFHGVPAFLRPIVTRMARRNTNGALRGQGIGRHTRSEVNAIAIRDLEAIKSILGDKKFFGGAKPTEIDCCAYGVLAGAICTPFNDAFLEHARTTPTLVAYVDRMHNLLFPELERKYPHGPNRQ